MVHKTHDWQEEDVEYYLIHPRAGLWYQPRLGKTVVALNVNIRANHRLVYIVCPVNAITVWRDHIVDWYPELKADDEDSTAFISVAYGNAALRYKRYRQAQQSNASNVFIITTYGAMRADYEHIIKSGLAFKIESYVFDEYHRYMLSRKSKTVNAAKALVSNRLNVRIHPTSGTPTNKGPQNFWAILNLLDRKKFSSYYRFENQFCEIDETPFGRKIVDVKNSKQFQELLSQYGRIRKRVDVAPDMPKIQRAVINVEMTSKQQRIYDELGDDSMFFTESGDVVAASTTLEAILRKRQVLCCPALLDSAAGVGGAMEHLTLRLKEADTDEERHVVIFSPFRPSLDIFQKHLQSEGFQHSYVIGGGVSPYQLDQNIKLFRQHKGIMLCTIQFAQAFSLEPAQECLFIGAEWDPNMNSQAEERLLPQKGVNPIISNYYSYRVETDRRVWELNDEKFSIINRSLG